MSTNAHVSSLYLYCDQFGNAALFPAASAGEAIVAADVLSGQEGFGTLAPVTDRPASAAFKAGVECHYWRVARVPQGLIDLILNCGNANAIYSIFPAVQTGPAAVQVTVPQPPGPTLPINKILPAYSQGVASQWQTVPLANGYFRDAFGLKGPLSLYKYVDASGQEKYRDSVSLVLANTPAPDGHQYTEALVELMSPAGHPLERWQETPGLPYYLDVFRVLFNRAPAGSAPLHDCPFDHEFLF